MGLSEFILLLEPAKQSTLLKEGVALLEKAFLISLRVSLESLVRLIELSK